MRTSAGSSARPSSTSCYPSDRMLPALEATLSELGIDLRSQQNVHLDLESRPGKSPRAFCAPIEVPGKVMLVIQPIGGQDDWRGALPRGRAHRALREHLAPSCRSRRGASATWRSRRAGRCCCEHLVTSRRGSTGASTCRASTRSRTTARRRCSTSCGATARSSSTRSSSSRRTTRRRCASVTPSFSPMR